MREETTDMTLIDIPDPCDAKPSDGRYKEFVLKFFETLEKKYGIKFKMMPQNDYFKCIRICVQRKNHKNYETVCLIPIKYRLIDNNGNSQWKQDPFTWYSLFNRIFTYNGEGKSNFRFNGHVRNVYYSTPLYKTFDEFKIAVDMGTITFEPVRR